MPTPEDDPTGGIRFRVAVESRSRFGNGKPIRSEPLPDGRTRHFMEDGRTFTVSKPNYRLEYQSNWMGAEEGDTYDVNISIAGLSDEPGFFLVWNFDIGQARNYAFDKTVRIVHLEDGHVFTGAELREQLGG